MKFLKIQQLRQKSKATRNNIALGVASSFTAILFAVWVLVDPSGISESVTIVESEKPRVFGGLIDQIKEQVAGAREAIEVNEETDELQTDSNVVMPIIPPEPEFVVSSSTTASSTEDSNPREIRLYVEPGVNATSSGTSGASQ